MINLYFHQLYDCLNIFVYFSNVFRMRVSAVINADPLISEINRKSLKSSAGPGHACSDKMDTRATDAEMIKKKTLVDHLKEGL